MIKLLIIFSCYFFLQIDSLFSQILIKQKIGKTRYRIEFVSCSDGYSSYEVKYFNKNSKRWETQAFSNYSTFADAKNALLGLEITREVQLKQRIGKTRYQIEFVNCSEGYSSYVVKYFDKNSKRWETQAFSNYSTFADAKNALLGLGINTVSPNYGNDL